MDIDERALALHKKHKGKLEVISKIPIRTKEDLSLVYTPGVGAVSRAIAKEKSTIYDYTIKGNSVAVVTDGSAVLGLGDIGPEAAMPVMEGKAALFKTYAGIDAYPIALATRDVDEIVRTVTLISPGFGGINLEDISAPRCFEVEERLQDIGIPVFHDDQHGTAIVLLAALINAAKLAGKDLSDLTVVIAGAGAAGVAITKLLNCMDQEGNKCITVRDIIMVDSKGIIGRSRTDLNAIKKSFVTVTNKDNKVGTLAEAFNGADVFIGVSAPNTVTKKMIASMAKKSIIFAMANPVPEIMPDEAKKAGAFIVATGRSDFPNQVNNVLAFPGVFRGALDARTSHITPAMKFAAVQALASFVKKPTQERILPSPIEKGVAEAVAHAVREAQ